MDRPRRPPPHDQLPFPAPRRSPTTPPADSAPRLPHAPERAYRSSSSKDRHAPAILAAFVYRSPVPEDASRTSGATYDRSPASKSPSAELPPSSPAASPFHASGAGATRPSRRHDTSSSPERPTAIPTRAMLPS